MQQQKQQEVLSRRERLYRTALAAPVFSNSAGESWALLPRGTAKPSPVKLSSRKYKEWLCERAEEKAGLLPGPRLLGEVVSARRSDAAHENGDAPLRIHRLRDGSIYLHLGCDDGDCLRMWAEGWDVAPAPGHIHFRYPEKHLPLPQPIHTDDRLASLLSKAYGASQGTAISSWLVGVLRPRGSTNQVLLFTGAQRFEAARALVDLLDPREPVSREPAIEDDWLLFYAEFSHLRQAQLDELSFYAGIKRRPVIVTASGIFAGLDNFMEINVPVFDKFDPSEALGALAAAVSATIRAPRKASSSPSRS